MIRLFPIVLLAGCFSPLFENAKEPCATDNQCPPQYHCAIDNKCWENGSNPAAADMSVPDMAVAMDSGFADMSPEPSVDLADSDDGSSNNTDMAKTPNPDLAPSPDLAPPPLSCGQLVACINPCTNQSCVTNCEARATSTALALDNAYTTCIQNKCDLVDGGNDGFVCCELESECEKAGDDFSSQLVGTGFSCANTICSGRGACADQEDACMADK